MLGLLAGLVGLVLIAAGFAVLVRKVRSSKGSPAHGRWLAGAVVAAVVVVGAVAAIVVSSVSEQRAISRPIPSFPSLSSAPDPSLEGRVAFVAERKDVAKKSFDACAVVAEASGAKSSEIACWPFDPTIPVTVRWTTAKKLEITAWDRSAKDGPKPIWSKLASLDGTTVDQEPSLAVAPATDGIAPPEGATLAVNDANGSATITMSSPEGSRQLLDVTDAQLWWHLLGQPAWSPSGAWIATADSSGRLLITTTSAKPSTRILADGVIGLPDEISMPVLAVEPS